MVCASFEHMNSVKLFVSSLQFLLISWSHTNYNWLWSFQLNEEQTPNQSANQPRFILDMSSYILPFSQLTNGKKTPINQLNQLNQPGQHKQPGQPGQPNEHNQPTNPINGPTHGSRYCSHGPHLEEAQIDAQGELRVLVEVLHPVSPTPALQPKDKNTSTDAATTDPLTD